MEMTLKIKGAENTFSVLITQAETEYNKDQLQYGWYARAIQFFNSNINKSWQDVDAYSVVNMFSSRKLLNKPEMMRVVSHIFKNEAVFSNFLSSQPKYIATLLEKLTWEKVIDRKSAELITGMDIFEKTSYSWQGPELKKELQMFKAQIQGGYYNADKVYTKDAILYLPIPVRKLLSSYFPKPEGYFIKPIPKPEMPDALFLDAEESINRELPLLLSYYFQGQISYTNSGRPNAAGVKKLPRVLQLKEFFHDSDYAATRSRFMADFVWGFKQDVAKAGVCEIIKYLFQVNFLHNSPVPGIFTLLKGFNYFMQEDFNKEAPQNIWNMFKALPENEWVAVANLHQYSETHFMNLAPASDFKLTEKISYEDEGTRKTYLKVSDFKDFVFHPFVAGAAFIFASFGLMEICYKSPPDTGFAKSWFSEYDGLIAVRLTSLGAFVLGLRNTYQPPVSESGNRLILEPNNLVIRIEGNPDLAQIQLTNYAQKVSGNRYQFSAALFLKDCKKAVDITNKISLFKQTIGITLPPNWEAYLNVLVANSKRIKRESKMVVFRLPPDDKELHRLLVQDDTLKKLMIKAEQFHILVEPAKEAAFRNRLKEFGILLE